jgi:hypothetical protein
MRKKKKDPTMKSDTEGNCPAEANSLSRSYYWLTGYYRAESGMMELSTIQALPCSQTLTCF